jgi:copper chaperone
MTCGGCSGAVSRALQRAQDQGAGEFSVFGLVYNNIHKSLPGISSYDVDLQKQEVVVKGNIPYDDLLEKIKKTGKEVGVSPS